MADGKQSGSADRSTNAISAAERELLQQVVACDHKNRSSTFEIYRFVAHGWNGENNWEAGESLLKRGFLVYASETDRTLASTPLGIEALKDSKLDDQLAELDGYMKFAQNGPWDPEDVRIMFEATIKVVRDQAKRIAELESRC